jgi:hypothetical protein
MSSNQTNPVIPSDETVKSGVFDKPEKSAEKKANIFNATPGPAIPKDTSVFEKPASHEELKARTAELNDEKK